MGDKVSHPFRPGESGTVVEIRRFDEYSELVVSLDSGVLEYWPTSWFHERLREE